MPSSRRQAARPSTGTSGYIAMRWYQHSLHGVKWAPSEKYRLPLIEMAATRKARTSASGPTSSTYADFHRAAVGEIRAMTCSTTVAATVTSATMLNSARNRVTVSVVILRARTPGGWCRSDRRHRENGAVATDGRHAPTQQPITVVATLTATAERSCRGSPNCIGSWEV